MINKSEIMEFSREFGLRANVVEKDYVLGWLLAGIFNHPVIGSSFVFKGGTCLKKCFFETYRFSEDLDFTLSESSHLDKEFLVSCFKEIAQWVYNETGREVHHPYSDSPSEGIRIKSYCFEEVFRKKSEPWQNVSVLEIFMMWCICIVMMNLTRIGHLS